jgi:hypothetical protein
MYSIINVSAQWLFLIYNQRSESKTWRWLAQRMASANRHQLIHLRRYLAAGWRNESVMAYGWRNQCVVILSIILMLWLAAGLLS